MTDSKQRTESASGPTPDLAAPLSSPWALAGLAAVTVFLGIRSGWSLVIVILALVVMIFMHELGHYLAARRAGMKVTEFFIGFGPRLWSFRRGETEYGIKMIWLGAYVKVIGMNNLDEVDPSEEQRTYRQGTYGSRMLLAVAGSAMHFLMALVMLYALLVGFGLEIDEAAWSVENVAEASTAEAAGIQQGDRIIEIDGEPAERWSDMVVLIGARPNENVAITYEHEGEIVQAAARLGVNPETGNGLLGVQRSDFGRIKEGPLGAVPATAEFFGTAAKETIIGIGNVFSPSGIADLVGKVFSTGEDEVVAGVGEEAFDDEGRIISVVGATRIGAALTDEGIEGLLVFMVTINIFIGIFNLMPLLPLDGGHVAVATYEKIRELQTNQRRYHVDAEKLLPITYAVLLLLMVVGLSAIYLDIADPIVL